MRLLVALLLASSSVPIAPAKDAVDTSDSARALVERAIAAQGGREQVAKLFKPWHAK